MGWIYLNYLELQNLREGEQKLKLDIVQKKEDIER